MKKDPSQRQPKTEAKGYKEEKDQLEGDQLRTSPHLSFFMVRQHKKSTKMKQSATENIEDIDTKYTFAQ
jgi:hypothetical protein